MLFSYIYLLLHPAIYCSIFFKNLKNYHKDRTLCVNIKLYCVETFEPRKMN